MFSVLCCYMVLFNVTGNYCYGKSIEPITVYETNYFIIKITISTIFVTFCSFSPI